MQELQEQKEPLLVNGYETTVVSGQAMAVKQTTEQRLLLGNARNKRAVFSVGPCREVISETLEERKNIFIRDNPIFSSERILHEDYDHDE
jgi:hypothetical protein